MALRAIAIGDDAILRPDVAFVIEVGARRAVRSTWSVRDRPALQRVRGGACFLARHQGRDASELAQPTTARAPIDGLRVHERARARARVRALEWSIFGTGFCRAPRVGGSPLAVARDSSKASSGRLGRWRRRREWIRASAQEHTARRQSESAVCPYITVPRCPCTLGSAGRAWRSLPLGEHGDRCRSDRSSRAAVPSVHRRQHTSSIVVADFLQRGEEKCGGLVPGSLRKNQRESVSCAGRIPLPPARTRPVPVPVPPARAHPISHAMQQCRTCQRLNK